MPKHDRWIHAEAPLTDSVQLGVSAREEMQQAQIHLWSDREDMDIVAVEITVKAMDTVAAQWLGQRGYGVLAPRVRKRLVERAASELEVWDNTEEVDLNNAVAMREIVAEAFYQLKGEESC